MPPLGQGDGLLAEGQVLHHQVPAREHGPRGAGRRTTWSRIIEPGRVPAPGIIVNDSGSDGLVASDRAAAGKASAQWLEGSVVR